MVLEKQLKGSDADEACRLFQAWSDDEGSAPPRDRKSAASEADASPRKPRKSAADSGKPASARKSTSKKKPEAT
jgi:hypothetical protein